MIAGMILMLVGWFLVLRGSKGDSYAMGVVGFLLPFLAPWVIAAVHYRDLKGAFWIQTWGAFLIAGAALLNLAVQ